MKKKEKILISGCSKGLGYDLYNFLQSNFYVFGLSSNKLLSKKKNIFYYNPLQNPKIDEKLEKNIKKINVDHVVHCSGGGFKQHDNFLKLEKLVSLFNINFFSQYEINKCLIKNKKKQKKLNIILIGSIASFENNKGSIGYSASKTLLLNYNKLLSAKFKNHNVISKLIIPGTFKSTKGSVFRLKKSQNKIFNNIQSQMPNKKFQSSKDINSIISFLLRKESNLLNGSYVSLANLETTSIFL